MAGWTYLEENLIALILQVIAACLIAFAARVRLDKSIPDLWRLGLWQGMTKRLTIFITSFNFNRLPSVTRVIPA